MLLIFTLLSHIWLTANAKSPAKSVVPRTCTHARTHMHAHSVSASFPSSTDWTRVWIWKCIQVFYTTAFPAGALPAPRPPPHNHSSLWTSRYPRLTQSKWKSHQSPKHSVWHICEMKMRHDSLTSSINIIHASLSRRGLKLEPEEKNAACIDTSESM